MKERLEEAECWVDLNGETTVMKGRSSVAMVLLLVGMGLMGCSSSSSSVVDDEADERPERARYGSLQTSGLEVEKVDLNGDDQPDQWIYRDDEGEIVRIERDLDFNGQIDMWKHYEGGELVEEEMSLDVHPSVDVVTFYREGRVVRQLMASQYDQTFPIEKIYDSEEQLLRVERDTSSNGQVDVWEYYEDGERARIGWDTTGDGQPDRFDRL